MRCSALFVSILAGLLLAVASAGAALTDKNSVELPSDYIAALEIKGIGCNATAAVTEQLPAGAKGAKIVKPAVGDRDKTGTATVTAAVVSGSVATIMALGDGPAACDQENYGTGDGQPLGWTARYDFEVKYTGRVEAKARNYFHMFGTKLLKKPRSIFLSAPGTERGFRLQIRKIKWKQFGGSKAIGSGRRYEDCPRGGNCPTNNRKVKIVLSAPRQCSELKAAVYTKLQTFRNGRRDEGMRVPC